MGGAGGLGCLRPVPSVHPVKGSFKLSRLGGGEARRRGRRGGDYAHIEVLVNFTKKKIILVLIFVVFLRFDR